MRLSLSATQQRGLNCEVTINGLSDVQRGYKACHTWLISFDTEEPSKKGKLHPCTDTEALHRP